jgi:hypothetical protein
MKIPPLAYPNPHRRAPPTVRYFRWYCEPGFRIGFRTGFVKRGFLVSRAITKLRVLAYQHCMEAGAEQRNYFK